MGLFERLNAWFPTSDYPAHHSIDESDTLRPKTVIPTRSDVFREVPMPVDPLLAERRIRIRERLAQAAFRVPGWDESTRGPSPLPFYELPPEVVLGMPGSLRASYEAERAAAADPRSGPRLVPYRAQQTE